MALVKAKAGEILYKTHRRFKQINWYSVFILNLKKLPKIPEEGDARPCIEVLLSFVINYQGFI